MQERVLVTGGSGFLGSRLADKLGERALSPRRSELDLLDSRSVLNYLEKRRPGAIIHAAGFVGGIGLNTRHPGRMAVENLRMGLNILEEAARLEHIHVVVVSTICVYPSNAAVPITENSIYEGYPAKDTAAYGLAKRELLSVGEALRTEFGLDFSYVIPTNLYGPGDHFDEAKSHVVPALIKRIHEAKESGAPFISVWGDGTATRDLLYVDDAADAIVKIVDSGPFPFPLNIGSGRELSIRELVMTLKSLIGYEGEIRWDTSRPSGASRRLLDIGRAKEAFQFAPRVLIEDGLRKSIDWYTDRMRMVNR